MKEDHKEHSRTAYGMCLAALGDYPHREHLAWMGAAQSIQETGWGDALRPPEDEEERARWRPHHNWFGIKPSREHHQHVGPIRVFANPEESAIAWAYLVTASTNYVMPRYTFSQRVKSLPFLEAFLCFVEDFCKVYCPDANYVSSVLSIMNTITENGIGPGSLNPVPHLNPLLIEMRCPCCGEQVKQCNDSTSQWFGAWLCGCTRENARVYRTRRDIVVFVAGPYRSRTEYEVEINIRRAWMLATELWALGFTVFCPHANSSRMGGLCLDQVFLEGGLVIMNRAVDALALVDDYGDSNGTKGEVVCAEERGLPLFHETDLQPLCNWADALIEAGKGA